MLESLFAIFLLFYAPWLLCCFANKKALNIGVSAFPLQAEFCGEANMACATFYKKGKAL